MSCHRDYDQTSCKSRQILASMGNFAPLQTQACRADAPSFSLSSNWNRNHHHCKGCTGTLTRRGSKQADIQSRTAMEIHPAHRVASTIQANGGSP
mmetsp:Transcript_23559/g.42499  ORF Transcript_23559/g.42499 Transcript_23559/m.42499 type:complete len:95 (-) Transcript_23559:237-521(-)